MPPPKKTQHELHQIVATLYAESVIDTRMSLGQVLKAAATRGARAGAGDDAIEAKTEALKKSLRRAYKGEADRRTRLWHGVVDYAERPSGDFMRVELAVDVLDRLKTELRTNDPVFAAFTRALEAAHACATTSARAAALRSALKMLPALTPSADALDDGDDTSRQELIERLSNVSGAYGQVYDLAISDSGNVPRSLLRIAQDAIRGGHAARKAARALRRRPAFGYRQIEGPRRVSWHGSDIWVGAVAVLIVLQRVPTEQVVTQTSAWAAQHLGVRPGDVAPAEVLTHAAETLVRMGRRHEASAAVEAAWATGSTSHVWEELLDLSITLAAASFGHGERNAAAEILNGELGSWLQGEYPGNPDEGWGSSVDVRLYQLVQAAVDDPTAAVAAVRRAWAAEVGAGGYGRSMWVLTALLVECLVGAGDTAGAAEIARLGARLVSRRSGRQLDAQLAAHLSEMFSTERAAATAATSDRVAALLEELTRIVLREPEGVQYDQRNVLAGLAAVADAARFERRVGPLAS